MGGYTLIHSIGLQYFPITFFFQIEFAHDKYIKPNNSIYSNDILDHILYLDRYSHIVFFTFSCPIEFPKINTLNPIIEFIAMNILDYISLLI